MIFKKAERFSCSGNVNPVKPRLAFFILASLHLSVAHEIRGLEDLFGAITPVKTESIMAIPPDSLAVLPKIQPPWTENPPHTFLLSLFPKLGL